MGTLAISQLTAFIITTINNTACNKKDVLRRLLRFHQGFISDAEIIEIIDFYKRKSVVIEAVLSSGALTEAAAYRMLQLFPTKKHYRDLVDKTYGHAQDASKQSKDSFFPQHESMFDGKMVNAHA